MIFIVNHGLGNFLSVTKAFEEIAGNRKVILSQNPKAMEDASHIVLPGVGNFKKGMKNLLDFNFIDSLVENVIIKKKPFLGICLGMQLLAEVGEESGETSGLGWIPGRVHLLEVNDLKLPHIGWNDLEIINSPPLFENISQSKEFYFVHSYYYDSPEEYIIAQCTYGKPFAAAIHKDNIYATQFHPEKSRDAGLKLLKNFLKITC